jgi:S1-C subfamily serine protease
MRMQDDDQLMDAHDRIMRVVMNRRARLGIKVNLQARATDSIGAYVESVTPSGPAAKAGIKSGDIITKLNGKSVLSGGPTARDARQSSPGLRLIELAARLQPNDTVAVEFRRGKDRKTVSVVTEDEPDVFVHGGGGPGARAFGFRMFPDRPGGGLHQTRDFMERFDMPFEDSPLADLELAPLNPDLGQYFGSTEGVLVISAPKESSLGLRGGDVVTAVDGRKPASPAHLLRILRSYERGENFKVDIIRNRKHEMVTAKLEDRER